MVQQLELNLPGMKSKFTGVAAFNDILAKWSGSKIVLAIDEFDFRFVWTCWIIYEESRAKYARMGLRATTFSR